MQLPDNITRLVRVISNGLKQPAYGAFLWVGAGLSIPAGYPSWGQLAERLRKESLEPIEEELDALQTVDAFVKANGRGYLSRQLKEIFDQKSPLAYHQDLMRLPWKGIVTTNYDGLLEDALKDIEKQFLKVTLEDNLDLVPGDQIPLLKVHGDITDFSSIVLDGKSYEVFPKQYPFLKADLESYLRKHSVIFFGCSMTDPRLLDWLRGMEPAQRENLMPSCVVLTKEEWNRIPDEDQKLLEEGNIRPILLKDHSEIPELISYLVKEIVPEEPPQTFHFHVSFASEDRQQWRIVAEGNKERLVDVPWKENFPFVDSLKQFTELTKSSVFEDDQRTALHSHAARLGDGLGQALLPEDVWQRVRNAAGQGGPVPVTLESDDDLTLSLPWELVRANGEYVVREGQIDLSRSSPAAVSDPAELVQPDRTLKLVVNVSAPEASSQLNYEAGSYRLVRALHEHSAAVFTELGTVNDLVDTVVEEEPLGVHFSGHGEPGALVFEDDEGQGHTVAIEELLKQIRLKDGQLPRFFYLASCHGNTAPQPDSGRAGSTLSAAQLHREGVTQVVGYYGPIADELSTLAEVVLYRSLAEGKTTRYAIRQTRAALAKGPSEMGRWLHRDDQAKAQTALNPFAWAQLVFYHRGPEYPLSQKMSADSIQAQEAKLQRSFEGTDQRKILSTGFIGRRRELHQFRRAVRKEQHVFVFQGLGGLGKSTFAFQALPILTRGRACPPFTIWCQELETTENQARGLTDKLSEFGHQLFGDKWIEVLQSIDLKTDVKEPQRFRFLLQAILDEVDHLVIYLDNLESLFHGPDNDEPNAFGNWRGKELEQIWRTLKKMSGAKLSVIASCRYQNRFFEADIFHISEMHNHSIFRMMGWLS